MLNNNDKTPKSSRRRFIRQAGIITAGTVFGSSLLAACGDATVTTGAASATTAAGAGATSATGATTAAAAGASSTVVGINQPGLPLVSQKATLKFVAPKAPLAPNFGDMEIFKRLEAATNIHIEWNNIPDSAYQEKKNLLLASGDLPDAFYNAGFSDADLTKYAKDGTIIQLDSLLEKNMPNLTKRLKERPDLKALITSPDGHIYTLPRAEESGLAAVPYFTSINKAWLDKLGLKMPTTPDELHDVLVAFKTKDPNGSGKGEEIPFSFIADFWCADIADLIFSPFGLPDTTDHKLVKDGKVIYTATQPQYKEAISYFSKWVSEGLVDKESFTQDAKAYLAKGKLNPESLGAFVWWETEEVVGTDRAKDYVLLPPLKGKDGKIIVSRSNNYEVDRGVFVITKANKQPDLTLRWVDVLYEPKMSAQINWGPIGIIYKEDANGQLVNMELPAGTVMGEYRQKVAPGGPLLILNNDFGKVVDMEARAKVRKNDINTIYAPNLWPENFPKVFLSADELTKVNRIQVDLDKLVKQKRSGWMLNGGIDKEWDSYLGELKKIGLDDALKIWQDALDRYKAQSKSS
jgi:putative aldouronate transport system substrate-binding protein